MFGKLGQIASMMKNLPKLKASMEELQQKLGQITAEGNAGGGMVTAKVNGRTEVISCTIGEEAWKLQDREMLEDLVVAAINQAIVKVNQLRAEETSKIANNLGMPLPGDGLPEVV
jgi:DNA-binding YbaB/EbfC family protein